MIFQHSAEAVAVFAIFVAITLGLSFYFAARTRSAQGYFAAGGSIHWFVNGVAFAGDYLSAASFLGICGMIAFYGYDGFLYSIGYLAGWIVALLVVAEPLKRLGRYTFADALDARFQSRSIKLAAGISTLAVSIFYLIPQMVGAGVLIKPLLGFEHWVGVSLVGAVVILIVVTAGMVSTTYVQFLKGSLLVIFSTILTVLILQRGFRTEPYEGFRRPQMIAAADRQAFEASRPQATFLPPSEGWDNKVYFRESDSTGNTLTVWRESASGTDGKLFSECQTVTKLPDGKILNNGRPAGLGPGQGNLYPVGQLPICPAIASRPAR